MTHLSKVAAVAMSVILVAACGSSSESAGEAVPQLADELQKVDDSLSAGEYQKARSHIRVLTSVVLAAQEAEAIDSDQAAEILAAASDLRASLPAASTTAPPSDVETDDPSVSREGDDEGDEGKPPKEEKEEKEHSEPQGKAKGHDKQDD